MESLVLYYFGSRQLAEEVLKSTEGDVLEEEEAIGSGFEGMEALTRAIETGYLNKTS